MSENWLIGIPTYKRPGELARALESISRQQEAPACTIYVIDNDPEGSAGSVVSDFAARLDIVYDLDPRPGVVFVRNAILEHAKNYDYLVFLDDDQMAGPHWLAEMRKASRVYPGAIIKGPCSYALPEGASTSSLHDVAFGIQYHEEGASLAETGTGNSMIPISSLSHHGRRIRFDEKYSLTGGEDTKYFRQQVSAGSEIRWWPAAVVQEVVPAERASASATRERFIRAGHVNAMLKLESADRASVLVGCVLRITLGAILSLVGVTSRVRLRGHIMFLSGRGGLRVFKLKGGEYYGRTKE